MNWVVKDAVVVWVRLPSNLGECEVLEFAWFLKKNVCQNLVINYEFGWN